MNAESTSPQLRVALLASLSFVLALAAYAPAFEGPFVWDDQTLILRREVTQLQSLWVYFSRPFWLSAELQGGAAYYRPLTILSLALDHALYAGNSTGFHLTNLVLHGANSVFVFLLARRLQATPTAALLSALLFAWFPRLSEAAAWISGRTDVLATVFSLAALLVTLSGRRWLAAILVFLGLASKEVSLAALLSMLGYEWWQARKKAPKERALALLPLSLALASYLVLRARVVGAGLAGGDLGALDRVFAAFESIGRYAFMLVDGWQPQLNIGALGHPHTGFVALGAVVALALAALAWRLRSGEPECLLVGCALVGVGLVLHVLPLHTTVVVADRFLYLPVAALAPIVGGRISSASLVRMRRHCLYALTGLLLSYLPFTWRRAEVWGDAIEFWATAVREQPHDQNALSHLGLGSLLAEHGMWDEAMIVLNRAQPGNGHYFLLARNQQAQLLVMNGETERALAVLQEAARLHPMPALLSTIARIEALRGQNDGAQQALDRYRQLVQDESHVQQLAEQMAKAEQARPNMAPTTASFAARITRARSLAGGMLFRVAMSEFIALLEDPEMTTDNLRAILVFSLQYGTPTQVAAVHRRLLQLDPQTPEEFSLLVAEREDRVRRLRRLCENLGVPVHS